MESKICLQKEAILQKTSPTCKEMKEMIEPSSDGFFSLCEPVKAAKWVSKKFSGNEKMPKSKLLPIAEESHGVYPKVRKTVNGAADNSRSRMQLPGLVARLMGLESMPIVNDRPRRALDSSLEESDKYSPLDQVLCGMPVTETRLHKVQRTSTFLEQHRSAAVVRFAADGLGRSLMSRSRKQQQQRKLVTPLKSPRIHPRKSSAMLIEVASKLLEPGSHSKNNRKYAIAYLDESSPAVPAIRSDVEHLEDAFVGSCRDCGGLVEVAEVRFGTEVPVVAEPCSSSVRDFSSYSSYHMDSKEGEGQMHFAFVSTRSDPSVMESRTIHTKINPKRRTQDLSKGKCVAQYTEDSHKQRNDGPSSSSLVLNNSKQSQLPVTKGKTLAVCSVYRRQQNISEANRMHKGKDVISSKRNPNGYPHIRTPSKAAGTQRQHKEIDCERSTGQKRRITSSPQVENALAVNSKIVNLKNESKESCNQRRRELASHVLIKGNSRYAGSRREAHECSTSSSSGNNIVVSFSFSSPIRRDTKFSSRKTTEAKSIGGAESNENASYIRMSTAKSKVGGSAARRGLTLKEGSLSNHPHLAITKLTSLNQDQLEAKGVSPRTCTSSIFEELLSSCVVGAPESQTSADSFSLECSPTHDSSNEYADVSSCNLSCDRMPTPNNQCQEEANKDECAVFTTSESNHHSLMSILEVPFSNDSSFSETCTGNTGCETRFVSKKVGCSKTHASQLDNDLLDSRHSTPSLNMMDSESHGYPISENFLNHVKFESLKEMFVNVQVLLQSITPYQPGKLTQYQVETFLLDALATSMESFSEGLEKSSAVTEITKSNKLTGLLLECIIEFLHSKYDVLCKTICYNWSRLSLSLHKSWLITQILEELRKFRNMAGVCLNELVEKETKQSSSKWWTECEMEVFDTGIEVESHILQLLINEMVFDFCWLNLLPRVN